MLGRRRFVVDTSVAMKWIVDEEDSDKAELIQGAEMVAPALIMIEAGNVLRALAAKQMLTDECVIDLFLFLQTAPITIIDADEFLERRAMELALALRHPINACIYLSLAERMNQFLITADLQFIEAICFTKHAHRVLSLKELRTEAFK